MFSFLERGAMPNMIMVVAARQESPVVVQVATVLAVDSSTRVVTVAVARQASQAVAQAGTRLAADSST